MPAKKKKAKPVKKAKKPVKKAKAAKKPKAKSRTSPQVRKPVKKAPKKAAPKKAVAKKPTSAKATGGKPAKAPKAKAKTAPKPAPVAPAPVQQGPQKPKGAIGRVVHYYDRIMVAIVLLSGKLTVGDKILFQRGEREFTQKIKTIQVQHKPLQSASSGQVIGLKVDHIAPEGSWLIRD